MVKLSDVLEKSGYDVQGKTKIVSDSTFSSRSNGKQDEQEDSRNRKKRWEQASEGWDERLLKVTSFSRELAESFKMLRGKILFPGEGKTSPKTIMVTSASPCEGKSFIAANLAISLAHGLDQHSLLVGCDLRKPSLAKLFGVESSPGLVDYLQGAQGIPDLIRHTSVKKLSLLTSGISPANPSELLSSTRMNALVQELSERYEDRFVIFDSPPIQMASEAIVLAQAVDAVVLVVRYGLSGKNIVKTVVEKIGKEKIIGVVFNGYRSNVLHDAIFKEEREGYYAYYGE